MSYQIDSTLEYILIHYRWVFVCLFLLPVSLIFDLWLYFRNYLVFKLHSAPEKHHQKVRYVQQQIQAWVKNGQKQKMCTSRPGWQTVCFRRPTYKNYLHRIDVNLVDVLEVDTAKQAVRVEPLVTMGQLSATLIPLGWTIPVVPELDDLTVGGLVMGVGVETSSHKYGLFQHSCVAFELVLCDGTLVTCSKDENPDLFYAVPWSYGTLGILTAVEIKLIPCKEFIKLDYKPLKSLDDLSREFQRASRDPRNEYVEALVFNENESVLMTGVQSNKAELTKINRIGRWYKPWFFTYVQGILKSNRSHFEYIPLRDYYHRHSRALFWEIQDIIPFGNNPIFRFLMGWMVPPKISLLKLTQTNAIAKLYENNHIIQDMLVPVKHLKESVLFFDDSVKVYPLWLCPFKLPNLPGMVHPQDKDVSEEMYVDIGVYGVPHVDNFKPVETTRKLEKFVVEHYGFQMLYADTFMTREEFRKMFDHTLYDRMRDQLKCKAAFPEVYDKINRTART